jgi:hypothetical protein
MPTSTAPDRPILLAVDQQLGEAAALWVAPELSDPVGSLEYRSHRDTAAMTARTAMSRPNPTNSSP